MIKSDALPSQLTSMVDFFFFLNTSNRIHKTKQPKLQNLSHNLRACTAWRVWNAEAGDRGGKSPMEGEARKRARRGRNEGRQQTEAKERERKVTRSEANPSTLRERRN
jgi:hypothetical protein